MASNEDLNTLDKLINDVKGKNEGNISNWGLLNRERYEKIYDQTGSQSRKTWECCRRFCS
jgi:hypothetical protein